LSFSVFTQPKVVIYSGINSPTQLGSIDETTYLYPNWNVGINAGFGLEYILTNQLSITPTIEFNYYSFNRYSPEVMIPENRVEHSTGEASQITRLFVDFKLFDLPDDNFRVYFSSGGGYVIERIGLVRVTWSDLSSSEFNSSIQFPNKNYFVHTLGIGFQLKVLPQIDLDIAWKHYTNYSDRVHYSLNIGAVYQL